jgi:hypothetical protein
MYRDFRRYKTVSQVAVTVFPSFKRRYGREKQNRIHEGERVKNKELIPNIKLQFLLKKYYQFSIILA